MSGKINVDLSGKKFGSWKVLCRDLGRYKTRGIRWVCQCDCGTVRSVLGKYLRNGNSLSCGCANKAILGKQRFGKLTVLETIYGYKNNNRATYKCLCDCGNTIYVYGSTVRKMKSCGCSRDDNYTPYLDIMHKQFGKLLVKDVIRNYKNTHITYCKCQCDCGNVIYTRRNGLLSGNTKSCGCVHSPSLIGKTFGRLTVVKIDNTTQKLWVCRCSCGNQVKLTSYQLTSGHTKSCGCLRSESNSSGEILVSQILAKQNIRFKKEKSFDDCRGKSGYKLRFDFYLPDYNACIEYDGFQHFSPVPYFGGKDKFGILNQNDEIKNYYCKVHSINLIRIPYTLKKDEIEKIIKNNIQNPVTTTVV